MREGGMPGEQWSTMGPHDEFLELCAVSTSGDLTEAEQTKLREHLAGCSDCREALKEFQAAVDIGVPLLASRLSVPPPQEQGSFSPAQLRLSTPRPRATSGELTDDAELPTADLERNFAFSRAKKDKRSRVDWNYIWLPFAACVVLTIALGMYAFRASNTQTSGVDRTASFPTKADGRIEALERAISDAGHEREVLNSQLSERDKIIGDLRNQTEQQASLLAKMKTEQANLEQFVRQDAAAKQSLIDERTALAQKLDAAQVSLQRIESNLDLEKEQRTLGEVKEARLENQIKDLNGQLQDEHNTVSRQDDLLSHDRDIRELMGARDLYVAEVYDVKRDGSTQKSYGRVFYTKGKSLVFYAYDLNEEPGAKEASTFQAWGRRGPDKLQALNLGIFYEDNAAKKRWVLKFDNPKALAEIDAVFVTVEPKGGSPKPSGSPLLYAYLQLAPNHP